MAVKLLRDEAFDRSVTTKAQAVARELGLEMLPVADFETITPVEWKALVQLPAMKRFIGTLCEGYVVNIEAEEVAKVKRKNMRGARAETLNSLAQDQVLGKTRAQVYGDMLRGIAYQANREG